MKIYLVLLLTILISCKSSMTKTHAFRLKPGEDLKKSIQSYVEKHKIKGGWIATGVGSLTNYNIRFANQPEGAKGVGYFEITALTGTVSINGSHLHLSISDSTGNTIGGHLLNENIIYTTAEIIIQEAKNLNFSREIDGTTPWPELQIKEE